ncbi:MAG TPA: hypothetical protein VGK48_17555 [Terriglobia bacterium]|jgi:hypothetical protein
MKFEEEDNLEFADHEESSLRLAHADLLTERAEITAACLRAHPSTQAVAEDLLDIVEEILNFACEMVTISTSLYVTAKLAQEGSDTFDLSHEVFADSDDLLDVVHRADESSKNILDIVRDLTGRSGGGRYEQR